MMSRNNRKTNNRYFTNTENEYFFQFGVNDFSQKVNDFCDGLRKYNIRGSTPSTNSSDYLKSLKDIMKSMKPPYTVILEHFYVDKSFRDSYYRYFSSSHFNSNRTSRRLSFFQGLISAEDFLNFDISCVDYEEMMENSPQGKLVYYGSVVLNPVRTGAIGRTILDPRCLDLQKQDPSPIYMRLSNFKIHIYGRTLRVNAFPYRMQDEETTKCAEITFLNLMDYYSNSYPDYKNTLPGEILDMEKRHSYERVLPSRGMSYVVMSKLMYYFGFSPRLYDYRSVDSFPGSHITPQINLKRWLYYYVESGIPVAVELGSGKPKESGHSVICIGHGSMDKEKLKEAYELGHKDDKKSRTYLNSADFYDSFVIIDDNKPVYNIRKYDQLSQHKELKLASLAVPLNRRMCLDAPDAEATFLAILNDEKLGLDKWAKKGFLKKNEAVIMRMFLASSHSLKSYRVKTLKDKNLREYYAFIPMPRFVWVCELYKTEEYLDLKKVEKTTDTIEAFGEVVLDTTSVPTKENAGSAIIFCHYPGRIATRYPEDTQLGFSKMIEIDDDKSFPGFGNNLTKII